MATEVKLPELGEGIRSGDVLDIMVAVGDIVKAEQGIVELETDKATVEIPSPIAGKVSAVHVAKGQTVPIGGVLISVEAAASATPTPKSATGPEAKAAANSPKTTATHNPAPPVATPSQVQQPIATDSQPADPQPANPQPVKSPVTAQATVAASVAEDDVAGERDLAPAGPSVRRFAREVGVDLSTVTGTGPGGRITRDDVLTVVRQVNQENGGKKKSAASSVTASTPTPSTPVGSAGPVEGEHQTDAWGDVQIQKMTKIRKTIANKMHESWSTVPRVTNFDDADVTELERMRQGSKADYAKSGIKLTSMPFLIKAVALALRSNPLLNASIDLEHEQIIFKHYVNVGIAVDTDRGLVVPSLRQADQLSIPSIARRLQEIAESARTGSFAIDDLRGSTFSISNLGAIGGTYSTPIINTPEVAILLVGRSRHMPIVVDNEVVARLMMPLSLSYDHRLVDGGAAARFLNEVIGYLSTPSRLFIAP